MKRISWGLSYEKINAGLARPPAAHHRYHLPQGEEGGEHAVGEDHLGSRAAPSHLCNHSTKKAIGGRKFKKIDVLIPYSQVTVFKSSFLKLINIFSGFEHFVINSGMWLWIESKRLRIQTKKTNFCRWMYTVPVGTAAFSGQILFLSIYLFVCSKINKNFHSQNEYRYPSYPEDKNTKRNDRDRISEFIKKNLVEKWSLRLTSPVGQLSRREHGANKPRVVEAGVVVLDRHQRHGGGPRQCRVQVLLSCTQCIKQELWFRTDTSGTEAGRASAASRCSFHEKSIKQELWFWTDTSGTCGRGGGAPRFYFLEKTSIN
jgi:hypothetical protein